MDGLAGLLNGPRAQGAFVLRCLMDPPWGIHLRDGAPLSITTVIAGHAWAVSEDAEPVRLSAGDLVVWSDPQHWSLVDSPETEPGFVIHPDQTCTTRDGQSVVEQMSQGVRSWGNTASGETTLLTGVYLGEGEVGRRLVQTLPAMIVVRAAELDSPLPGLLAQEASRDVLGQDAVLDRLLDLLLITVLRHWFALPGAEMPPWYAAQDDPVVGPAVRLMQHQLEHPWTVGELAERSALSRAAFARRFRDVVGQPPMAFLTEWRLAVAADLLVESDATLTAVARQVGYGTPFALSAAFKRERGHSPSEHRARHSA